MRSLMSLIVNETLTALHLSLNMPMWKEFLHIKMTCVPDFQPSKTIMITSPGNVYPLTSHFYKVKLGITGVYIFLLFLL